MTAIDQTAFGSLGDVLKAQMPDIFSSAGPVSDAYIMATEDVIGIVGPMGSAKTTGSVKKAIVEATRIRPTTRDEQGRAMRRYVLGIWRQKYDNLWDATIPSWWKLLPQSLGSWSGAKPRAAQHVIRFEDRWGPIELVARFRAFGDEANPDDLKGLEYTDVWLNEMDTLPEDLFTMLVGRVGRDPARELIGRGGRIFGDMNAPSVTDWVYRDFFEDLKPGYHLYKQPSGFAPNAENIAAMGAGYWLQQAKLNAHRPWWIRKFIMSLPGFTRGISVVYPEFNDELHMAPATLEHFRELPIIVGIDGGLTPAAVFLQERPDGQVAVLAEIACTHASETSLARQMLSLMERRFPGCEFVIRCDPAMCAGDDTEDGSARSRLQAALGIPVVAASTNEPDARWEAVRDPLTRTLDNGRPGFLLDPSCKGLRRGFNQTYQYRKLAGSDDVSSVGKSFDSHIHDGLQYACLLLGSAEARRRRSEIAAEKKRRRMAGRNENGRYNPLRRHG
ncbi:MAG: hypothetical protein H6R00_247 [Proteobacteria bacterium]|nr:hypothetical protein [Pseudomonadota bacterium]